MFTKATHRTLLLLIGWISRCVWKGWPMDGLKSPIYLRSRISWVAERTQREKWPEADPQLAGVKVSKRLCSISHPFHKHLGIRPNRALIQHLRDSAMVYGSKLTAPSFGLVYGTRRIVVPNSGACWPSHRPASSYITRAA